MLAEQRETTKREDIEALRSRLESDKIWAGNEVEKLRIKKEAELELYGIHLDQAVSCCHSLDLVLCLSLCKNHVSERIGAGV